MWYRCITFSLTTVDSWLTEVICEVINPQTPDQDWQAPLQCFPWKLGSCRVVNSWRLSEQTQSPYLDLGNMCGHHTQRQKIRNNNLSVLMRITEGRISTVTLISIETGRYILINIEFNIKIELTVSLQFHLIYNHFTKLVGNSRIPVIIFEFMS